MSQMYRLYSAQTLCTRRQLITYTWRQIYKLVTGNFKTGGRCEGHDTKDTFSREGHDTKTRVVIVGVMTLKSHSVVVRAMTPKTHSVVVKVGTQVTGSRCEGHDTQDTFSLCEGHGNTSTFTWRGGLTVGLWAGMAQRWVARLVCRSSDRFDSAGIGATLSFKAAVYGSWLSPRVHLCPVQFSSRWYLC